MEIFFLHLILQAGPRFIIEIKCSALNLKYLSQYLNGLGARAFVKIFKSWFLDFYILIDILILLHHFYPTLKLFLSKHTTEPPMFFFLKFKNQTLIYNTLIYYLQLWFYNPNGLTKGKTNFTSLFTLSWIMPLRKFFLYIIAHFFLLPSKDLVAGFYGFIFFPKLNNRQDLRLRVGQNVCRLILTIDEK